MLQAISDQLGNGVAIQDTIVKVPIQSSWMLSCKIFE